jgi:outer membrane protein
MKKIFTVIMVALGLAAGSAGAQTKIGYIRIDDMVALMPEVQKIDTILQKYQQDSLNEQLSINLAEYQYKDSIINKTDTSKTPKSVLNQMRTELARAAYFINNFQQISQQYIQNKQEELLAPVYTKVYDAIKLVAKEKGYSHVVNKDAFLVAPEGDDMLIAVATKLKVKLPPQLQGVAKPPAVKPSN